MPVVGDGGEVLAGHDGQHALEPSGDVGGEPIAERQDPGPVVGPHLEPGRIEAQRVLDGVEPAQLDPVVHHAPTVGRWARGVAADGAVSR